MESASKVCLSRVAVISRNLVLNERIVGNVRRQVLLSGRVDLSRSIAIVGSCDVPQLRCFRYSARWTSPTWRGAHACAGRGRSSPSRTRSGARYVPIHPNVRAPSRSTCQTFFSSRIVTILGRSRQPAYQLITTAHQSADVGQLYC